MLMVPLALALASGADPDPGFLIGTYTRPEGSRGIYRSRLNVQTGEIAAPELAAELANPSYLAFGPDGRRAYAVVESSGGDLESFAVEPGLALRRLNRSSFSGGGPCHVSVDPLGRFAFAAAYGEGTVGQFALGADGALGAGATPFRNAGTGPDRGRQEGPHLHSIVPSPDGRFAYACDLGTDEVLVFRVEADGLHLAEPRSVKIAPGGGPRHLAIHPSGKFLFVNHEMGDAVSSFRRDVGSGALVELNRLSTLPDGVDGKANSTAAIQIHPNGRWLYVSNRGHDSLAAFSIRPDGRLRPIGVFAAGVGEPRGFSIDPTGRWIVVGGQRTNDLASLKIDLRSGRLSPAGSRVAIDRPVCVVFPPRR